MYRERPSTIAGATAWESVVDQELSAILPDGCMDVIWHDGRLFIAGPDTTANPFRGPVGSTMVAVRFGPGTAPRILGVPAHALLNQRVDLDAVWSPATVRRLGDEIADGGGVGAIERGAA